jgi:outer membrane protein assembly factor BamA
MHLSDPRAALSSSGTDKIFSAGLSFELDTRDLHTYPARGDLFRLNYFRSWIWEQGQCGTTELDVRHYSRLGPAIVATRLAGTLLQGKVPVYKHIFLGYGERIRGHFTQVAEGKARVQSSLAFRVPLLAPRRVNLSRKMPALQKLEFGLYGVVFGDLGVLWPEQPCWGTGQTWRGGGLGLNFILPYSSVLRTEYAWNESLRGEFILDMMVAF